METLCGPTLLPGQTRPRRAIRRRFSNPQSGGAVPVLRPPTPRLRRRNRTQPAPPPRRPSPRQRPTRPAWAAWALLAAAAVAALTHIDPNIFQEPTGHRLGVVVESTVAVVQPLPTPVVVTAETLFEAKPVPAAAVQPPPRARVRHARTVTRPAPVERPAPATDVATAPTPPPPAPSAKPKPKRKGLFNKLRTKRRKGV